MYYLYQHIRDDNGQVFYVGIGDKYRPNEKTSRNKFWKNIVGKTSYTIDIVKEFESVDDAKEWEKFFISIYGRRIDNSGHLVNLTFGGDGSFGRIDSEYSKRKRSRSFKLKMSYAIDAYDVSTKNHIGSFESISEASFATGVNRGAVHACIHKKQYHSKGITFCHYGDTPEWDEIESSINTGKSISGRQRFTERFSKRILMYSLDGELLAEYESACAAARSIGKSHSSISLCANNKPGHLTAYGYVWKWKQ
jgi:hypothetical protein